jgi:hypothetical protein
VNEGTLQVDSADALRGGSSLALTGSARVSLGGSSTVNLTNAVVLGDLSINADSTAPTATVELNKSKLVADKRLISMGTIRSQIKSAYAGGTWTGNGITSAAAAADYAALGTAAKTALGYVDNADSSSGGKTTFYGRSVDANAVLIRYTYYGDTNLDGRVNLSDFGILKANYGHTSGGEWYNGDFNYDNRVNLGDFGKLKSSYGSAVINSGAASVPEPSTIVLLISCLVGVPLGMRRSLRRAARSS